MLSKLRDLISPTPSSERMMMKDSDKMMFTESREIGSREMASCFNTAGKLGKRERKHPFNIFWAASVTDNCHSYRWQTGHFSGTDATQIMLKHGIYPSFPHGKIDKTLIFNEIGKRPKSRLFPAKTKFFGKNGKDLRRFCDK